MKIVKKIIDKNIKRSLIMGGVIVIVIQILWFNVHVKYCLPLIVLLDTPSEFILSAPVFFWMPSQLYSVAQMILDLIIYASLSFLFMKSLQAIKSYYSSRLKEK